MREGKNNCLHLADMHLVIMLCINGSQAKHTGKHQLQISILPRLNSTFINKNVLSNLDLLTSHYSKPFQVQYLLLGQRSYLVPADTLPLALQWTCYVARPAAARGSNI